MTWLVFSLYNFLLFYLSLLPGDKLIPVFTDWNDKLLHLAGYTALYAITYYTFLKSRISVLTRHALLWAFCWAMNVAAMTELLQYFVPGRFTDPYDLIANGVGVLLGVLIFKFVPLRQKDNKVV